MSSLYSKINTDWKQNFTGYSALGIILSTCLGSVAAMSILQNGVGTSQMIQLFIIVIICNLHNATILTVQKPKVVLNFLIISVIISVLISILNFIS